MSATNTTSATGFADVARFRTSTRRWSLSEPATWPAHWPLTVLVVAFPLWWILGISEVVPMLAAIPMAFQLFRRRRVLVPPGFTIWLLFLAWVLLGAFVLFTDAPGAVPGGGASRLVVFGYRIAWYLTCTIVLLWLGNQTKRDVSFGRVTRLFAIMFLFTVAGGLLAVAAPGIQLRSALEFVLPGSLTENRFVRSLIHPVVAEVQGVLGRPEPRPAAPFAFANSWGSNLSLFLPFFLMAWWANGARWQRVLTPVVLLLAAIPVIYSLNRGLWLSLLVGASALVILQVWRGRPAMKVASVLVLLVAVVTLALSPLGALIGERMDNPHSNGRRSQLLVETVQSASAGSPIIGFGSTRDVQGNFISIAGGERPDCSECKVPPLGTQGHLWLVIFSQGLVGAGLFLAFLARAGALSLPLRTQPQVVCGFVLGFFVLQLMIYDTLGLPFYTVMIAIALVWRERASERVSERGRGGGRGGGRERGSRNGRERSSGGTLGDIGRNLRSAAPVFAVLVLAGAVIGAAIVKSKPVEYASQASILLPASSLSLSTSDLDTPSQARKITIDTEAAMLVSEPVLARTVEELGGNLTTAELRERIGITAATNTRILEITARAGNESLAQAEAKTLAESFLAARRDYLAERRATALKRLDEQRTDLESLPVDATYDLRARIEKASASIMLTSSAPGEILRVGQPALTQSQLGVGTGSGAALGLLGASGLTGVLNRRRRHRRGRSSQSSSHLPSPEAGETCS